MIAGSSDDGITTCHGTWSRPYPRGVAPTACRLGILISMAVDEGIAVKRNKISKMSSKEWWFFFLKKTEGAERCYEIYPCWL